MMTLQEIFDRAVAHIRKQRVPSVKPGTRDCMYRDPVGNKCLIGAFVPDDAYKPEWDGASSGTSIGFLSLLDRDQDFSKVMREQSLLDKLEPAGALSDLRDSAHAIRQRGLALRELQTCHDYAANDAKQEGADFMEAIEANFRRFAGNHNLKYTKETTA